MPQMIAYCGLACHECPAYLATINDDEMKQAQIARLWSELFETVMKPEDVICDGCLSEDGRHFIHCRSCKIRACASLRRERNCAFCAEYPCGKIGFIFKSVPETHGSIMAYTERPAEKVTSWVTPP